MDSCTISNSSGIGGSIVVEFWFNSAWGYNNLGLKVTIPTNPRLTMATVAKHINKSISHIHTTCPI